MKTNNWTFKSGTVTLNEQVCGKVVDFSFSINNNVQNFNIKTKRKYEFNITMKLSLIDRIKRFFGMKTTFEKIMEM